MDFPLAKITDYEALEKISSEQMESYLVKKGWQLIRKNELATWWQSPNKQKQITVPSTTEAIDYSYRVGDSIRGLAAYEKRSEINVWLEMTND